MEYKKSSLVHQSLNRPRNILRREWYSGGHLVHLLQFLVVSQHSIANLRIFCRLLHPWKEHNFDGSLNKGHCWQTRGNFWKDRTPQRGSLGKISSYLLRQSTWVMQLATTISLHIFPPHSKSSFSGLQALGRREWYMVPCDSLQRLCERSHFRSPALSSP